MREMHPPIAYYHPIMANHHRSYRDYRPQHGIFRDLEKASHTTRLEDTHTA